MGDWHYHRPDGSCIIDYQDHAVCCHGDSWFEGASYEEGACVLCCELLCERSREPGWVAHEPAIPKEDW